VAWVFDQEGARNLWVAEAPDCRARSLTAQTGDDGQELAGLTWTPDGGTLVEELRQWNVAVEQLVFPDEAHSCLTHQHWLRRPTARPPRSSSAV